MDFTKALLASQARELALKEELEQAKIELALTHAKAASKESLARLKESQRRELESLGASQAASAPVQKALQKALKRTREEEDTKEDGSSQATEEDLEDPYYKPAGGAAGGGGGGAGGAVQKKRRGRPRKMKPEGQEREEGGGGPRLLRFSSEQDAVLLRIKEGYPKNGTHGEKLIWTHKNSDLMKRELPGWSLPALHERWKTLQLRGEEE